MNTSPACLAARRFGFALGLLWLAVLPVLAAAAPATRPAPARTADPVSETELARKTAVFVQNRAGKAFDGKVEVLEDLINARVAGEGFALISRDAATRGLRDHTPGGRPWPGGLDKELETSTSALRLAQNLGADYILVAYITTYGQNRRTYEGNGIQTTNVLHTLRVTSKIIEAANGGAIRGAHALASRNIRVSGGLQTDNESLLDELLDDAAAQVAAELAKIGRSETRPLAATVAGDKPVSFDISTYFIDLYEKPILVAGLVVSKDQVLLKSPQPSEVQPFDVTVELDGVVIGSAPGNFQARPGLHKLRLSREGIRTWERTIQVSAGQKLKVGLQMSDEAYHRWKEGYERWKDNVAFVEDLKNKARLTEAQARLIEGYAKFWHESFCRIDYRVDTKENFDSMWPGVAPVQMPVPVPGPQAPATPAAPAPKR